MIDLYYWGTPNGHKITIALEEMGLDYQIFPVNILENDQFQPDFLRISPNNKIPAIVDQDGPRGQGGIVEVRGTAEGEPFTREQMNVLMDLATLGIRQLVAAQESALAS